MRLKLLAVAVLSLAVVTSPADAGITFGGQRSAISPTLDRINILYGTTDPELTIFATYVDIRAVGADAHALKFAMSPQGQPLAFIAHDEAGYTNSTNPPGGDPGDRLTYGGLAFEGITSAEPSPLDPANRSAFQEGLQRVQYYSYLRNPFIAPSRDLGDLILASAVVPTRVNVDVQGIVMPSREDSIPFHVIFIPEPTGLLGLASAAILTTRRPR